MYRYNFSLFKYKFILLTQQSATHTSSRMNMPKTTKTPYTPTQHHTLTHQHYTHQHNSIHSTKTPYTPTQHTH